MGGASTGRAGRGGAGAIADGGAGSLPGREMSLLSPQNPFPEVTGATPAPNGLARKEGVGAIECVQLKGAGVREPFLALGMIP